MTKIKQAILAGMILAAMEAAPAQARGEDRSCFSQRTGSGYVKVCAGNNGGYEFGIKAFGDSDDERDEDWGDDDERDYDWREAKHRHHAYYYPVVYEPVVVEHHHFVPPGHSKHRGRGHHHCRH